MPQNTEYKISDNCTYSWVFPVMVWGFCFVLGWFGVFLEEFTHFAHFKSLKYEKMMAQVNGDVANDFLRPNHRSSWGSCGLQGRMWAQTKAHPENVEKY